MTISTKDLKKWFFEHLFETLVTAVVSLTLIIGGYVLNSIRKELNDLQCRMSKYAAEYEFRSVEQTLIIVPLEDVSRESDIYRTIKNIVSGYSKNLRLCKAGEDTLSRIEKYRDGLESYIDRNWEAAVASFGSIRERNALSEKSTASALLHKWERLKKDGSSDAGGVEQQYRARLASALHFATRENDYFVKVRAIEYLKCSGMFLDPDASGALACLRRLTGSGMANYAVYYNIAALEARRGDFTAAIVAMTK